MNRPDQLIAAIADEDARLRALVEGWPADRRERPGPGGAMSPKEVLGHLAFWDGFAVRTFESRLAGREAESAGLDFDRLNRAEMKQLRHRPWAAVLAAYAEATAGLTRFLRARWHELSEEERAGFLTPLRHRRHHRLLLARALLDEGRSPPGRREGRA